MEKFNHRSRSHHCRRSAMTHRYLGVIFLSALVSGCAPVSHTASEDRALFDSLCDTPDRNFAKDPVFVRGYGQAQQFEEKNSCLDIRDAILFDGYEYHECIQGAWRGGNNNNLEVYRYSLKPDGDTTCFDNEKIHLKEWLAGLQQRDGKFLGQCVGVEKYDKPSSRYIKLFDYGRVSRDGKHLPQSPPDPLDYPGYIAYGRTQVIDTKLNEKIFENRFYWYYPMGRKHSGSPQGKFTCNGQKDLKASDILRPAS